MQTSVTFKNIDPSENLKSYVGEKLDRFDKYLYNPAEANVVLSVEKFRHMAEINIIGDRLNIYGKEVTGDMYSAIDIALDKLEKQIKKNKEKITVNLHTSYILRWLTIKNILRDLQRSFPTNRLKSCSMRKLKKTTKKRLKKLLLF